MEYKIVIEGQTIPVPEEIGSTDDMVKNALRPVFPEVANASITRTEKDGMTTITVIKRAGSKGGLAELIAAPVGRNPVITIQEKFAGVKLDSLIMEELIDMDNQIVRAMEAGDEQNDSVGYALHRLRTAKPTALSIVPIGF